MRTLRVLTTIAALVAPLLLVASNAPADGATAPAAKATYHPPQVAFVGHVRAKGGKARVQAVYRCWGGNEGTHLWVSLKQGGGIKGKTLRQLNRMEGTSEIARAWYDTNVVDPSKVTINCNGKWQVHKYTVAREKGTLRAGKAYMQFCLFDSHADPEGMSNKGFAFNYQLLRVHRTPRHS
jgi:hypothetical protein